MNTTCAVRTVAIILGLGVALSAGAQALQASFERGLGDARLLTEATDATNSNSSAPAGAAGAGLPAPGTADVATQGYARMLSHRAHHGPSLDEALHDPDPLLVAMMNAMPGAVHAAARRRGRS